MSRVSKYLFLFIHFNAGLFEQKFEQCCDTIHVKSTMTVTKDHHQKKLGIHSEDTFIKPKIVGIIQFPKKLI